MVSAPETEAGRWLLEGWLDRRTHPPTAAGRQWYVERILAIEAEAKAQVLAEAIRRVEVMRQREEELAARTDIDRSVTVDAGGRSTAYGRVLAILRDLADA